MTSESGNDHHDPQFEPTNAKRRVVDGEFDMGTRIASAEFLSRPENLFFRLAMSRSPDEVNDELVAQVQDESRRALVARALTFLGDDGGLSLAHGMKDLRSVIEGFPKSSALSGGKDDFLRILDEVEVSLAEFTTREYEPGKILLTPRHIHDLQRLRVATFEVIKGMLPAIQYYGALMNYGERLEPPSFTLMDFRASLQAGEFLNEFLQKICASNHLTVSKALQYLRAEIVPALMTVFVKAAEKHDIDVVSINEVYEIVPLALEEALEAAKSERDGRERKKKERLVSALSCILKEMPDTQKGPILEEGEFDEDGLPVGLEDDEQGEETLGETGFKEGNPDSWRSEEEDEE